jgi:hypothetical protein
MHARVAGAILLLLRTNHGMDIEEGEVGEDE